MDSRFRKIGTGSLQIANVEESDAGSYQCRAITTEDTDDATAILEVQVPPRFIKKPQDIKEVAKKDIEFECEIYGKPEPIVQWLKNGEIIKHNAYLQLVNGCVFITTTCKCFIQRFYCKNFIVLGTI